MVEALVALLLTSFLLQASWSITAAARRAVVRIVARSEALETERVGWHVLSAEVAAGTATRDWTVAQRTVLPLRAFRGVGEVCPGQASPSGGLVRYRGLRLPEPEKDSLLLLEAHGYWLPVKLLTRQPTSLSCPAWGDEPLERWGWDPPVPEALLARVFERGSYHLESAAIRYRLGAAGRQPLTPERLDDRGSAFLHPTPERLELRLRVEVEDGVAREWTRTLAPGEDDG